MEEFSPKIPPLEHVEQLMAIDQSRQDSQKQKYRSKKKKQHQDDMEEILKDQQQRLAREDGHVDYHA
jgi:hypothetical protein